MFIRSVINLASASTASQIILVLSLPILIKIYEPKAFAIYALYIAIVNLVSSAASLRLEHAIVIAKNHHIKILYSTTVLLSFMASLISIVFTLISSLLSVIVYDHLEVFLFAVPLGIFFTALWNINYSFYNRQEKYSKIARSQIIKNIVLVSIQIIFGYLFISNIYVMLLAHILSLMLVNYLIWPNLKIKFKIKKTLLIFNRHYKFPKFSAPSIFTNTMGKSSIPFFIGGSGGEVVLGHYAYIERLLGVPSALIGSAVGRVYYRSASKIKESKVKALKLFNRTTLILVAISGVIFSSAYFFSQNINLGIIDENWQGIFQLATILVPIFFIKLIVVPVSMTTNVYSKQDISLYWNFTYLGITNILLLYIFNNYEGNYILLLNTYVALSFIFYLALLLILRSFITRNYEK